ncbi:hypothetical protein HAX54_023758, partial [Datura stramonium]|nr:hypothetical protein [Datura stramonium]
MDAELEAALKVLRRATTTQFNQQTDAPRNPTKETIATRVQNVTKKCPPEFHSPKANGKFKGKEKGSKRAMTGDLG